MDSLSVDESRITENEQHCLQQKSGGDANSLEASHINLGMDIGQTNNLSIMLSEETACYVPCFQYSSEQCENINEFSWASALQELSEDEIEDPECYEQHSAKAPQLANTNELDNTSLLGFLAKETDAECRTGCGSISLANMFEDFCQCDFFQQIYTNEDLGAESLTQNRSTTILVKGDTLSSSPSSPTSSSTSLSSSPPPSSGENHMWTINNYNHKSHISTEKYKKKSSSLASLLQMEIPHSQSGNVTCELLTDWSKSTEPMDTVKNITAQSKLQKIKIKFPLNTSCSKDKTRVPCICNNVSDSTESYFQELSSVNPMNSCVCRLPHNTSHFVSFPTNLPAVGNVGLTNNGSMLSYLNPANGNSEHPMEDYKTSVFNYEHQNNDNLHIKVTRMSDPNLIQERDKVFNHNILKETVEDLNSSQFSTFLFQTPSQIVTIQQSDPLDFDLEEIDILNTTKHYLSLDLSSSSSSSSSSPPSSSSSSVEEKSGTSDSAPDLSAIVKNIPPKSYFHETVKRLFTEQPELRSGLPFVSESGPSIFSERSWSKILSPGGTSTKPSLLRTLLDNTRAANERPATNTERVLEQVLKNKISTKQPKHSFLRSNSKLTELKNINNRRTAFRKSIELPLPRSNLNINYGRSNLQYRKPTKELPLPSTPVRLTNQSSMFPQNDNIANEIINHKGMYGLNSIDSGRSYHNEDFSLPDDLLDMAVQSCASLEREQTEALILDLNDNLLFEDNLYSLISSHAADWSSVNHTSSNCSQLLSERPVKLSSLLTNGQLPDYPTLKSVKKYRANEEQTDVNPSSMQTSRITAASTKHRLKVNDPHTITRPKDKLLKCVSSWSSNSTNRKTNTSLDLATVTASNYQPMNQIHVDNSRCRQASQFEPECDKERSEYAQNIMATKTNKLKRRLNLIKQTNKTTKVSLFTTQKPSTLVNTSNSLSEAYNHCNKSDQKVLNEYFIKKDLSERANGNGQRPSLQKPGYCGNIVLPKSRTSPFVLKISTQTGSSPSVVKINRTSQNNLRNKGKPLLSQAPPGDVSASDAHISSTEPVSVMIMRKHIRRSRRTSHASVQTDNQPGEAFPEFELSTSDKFLYPSVMIGSFSSRESPLSDTPCASSVSLSATTSSLPSTTSMCKLEKFLGNHQDDSSSFGRIGFQASSSDKIGFQASSFGQIDFQDMSQTPFLQRLLMGELSQVQYHLMDQQMLEQERKPCTLSMNKQVNRNDCA